MSQSELRNFEKSMAYHLAPAMLGIKPACLMSMEKSASSAPAPADVTPISPLAALLDLTRSLIVGAGVL